MQRIGGATSLLLLLLCLGGCQSTEEHEHAELATIARAHAHEREQARARALPIEAFLHPDLESLPSGKGCGFGAQMSRTRKGIALVACGDFGGSWPLRVSWGYLRCEPAFKKGHYRLVFSAAGGTEYALNWRARGVGYASIEMALRRDGGRRADVGVLVKRARTLCGQP